MNSASPHVSERALRLLGEINIFALAFPASATNIVQALDLVCFGPFKKLEANAFGDFGDKSVNDQSIELVQAH
jgi:hypothetical protein